MKKLKILQVNKFHFLKGGSERHVFDLSHKLREAGHEVIHFSMNDSRNLLDKKGERSYFIRKVDYGKFNLKNIVKLFYNRDAVLQIKKIIEEEKPDIVHLHNFAHQFSPAIISTIKKYNIPIVQTLHDYKIVCPNYKLYSKNEFCYRCKNGAYYKCLVRKCMKDSYLKSLLACLEAYYTRFIKTYQKIDYFIAPSNYMKNRVVEAGYDPDRIAVLYNFVNLPKLTSLKNIKKADYFLYFGRLSEEKGLSLLLDSFAELQDKKVKLKIVGLGPLYNKIKEKIVKMNLEKRVELLGYKKGTELEFLIDASFAVILPSLWPENMPYSLLEAMSRGKTIIASKSGGMAELIIDGENGFIFKKGDKEALKVKMEMLKKQDGVHIGINARNSLLKFSSGNYLRELLKIYKQLIFIKK